MDRLEVQDEVFEEMMDISAEQFEHCCKIVIEEIESPRDLELTPFRGDGGIDIRGVNENQFFTYKFGVEVKQHQRTIGVGTVRELLGAMGDHGYQAGCFITTSDFARGAMDISDENPVKLINGDTFTNLILQNEIGVIVEDDSYQVDDEFWSIFDETETGDLIPSEEIPQADNFNVVKYVLKAIDEGYVYKPQIQDYMIKSTGSDWTERQADYYALASYCLGFVHRDIMGEYDGQERRKWGLTREGQEYIELVEESPEEAEDLLHKRIRSADIFERILDRLEEESRISHQELKDIIEEESELGETTSERRASTVGKWLTELPEVRRSTDNNTYQYEYVTSDLSDY